MTTFRYTSTSFQNGMLPREAEAVAEKLVGYLDKNPVLRGAVIAIDSAFNQYDITAAVDAIGFGDEAQYAVMMAFHAADMEWLNALEACGARKRICNSSLVAHGYR